MALSIWMQVLDGGAATAASALRAALGTAGVSVRDAAHESAPKGFGVVLCGASDTALPQTVQALALNAAVLAIDCAGEPLRADTMWALLEAGAIDLLPWSSAELCAQQVAARLQRWDALQKLMASSTVRNWLVGDSGAWRALVQSVVEVAAFTQSPVLITGETGTGKDLIAQLIHRLSGAPGELTVLDCTTLSPELAGSELFGHERGAFTGALNARDGAFAMADGGTLFLDEVGELPLPLQAQLLRVIQEQKYKRVGSNGWQPSRFRLVCATNRDLEADIATGAFRADLFYRIAGWRCRPPPLRERQGDILPLVEHFLRQLDPQGQGRPLEPAVREYLLSREYKGNVRDLRQTVSRIWYRHTGPGPITIGDVPPDERLHRAPAWPDAPFRDAIRHAVDRGMSLARIGQAASDTAIRLVLEQEGDNNQRAAQRLGVTDRALQIRRKAAREGEVESRQ
ncbi:sigma 54-interacting transcriptional regulator [Massilia sp. METH4]|uniref:sigma-54-dependent transcriptional regulator n=1 Tax=Massilia sp. METH4 TaxID=3123041 RepID=UPI0030CABC34